MRIAGFVVQRKKTVILVWVIALLAVTPLLLNYGQYVSYSESPKSLSNSESAKAQQLLSSVAPANSTLVVVFQPKGETVSAVENQTLSFQRALNSSNIPFYSGSSSAFSSYEKFLDGVLTNDTVFGMRYTYSGITALSAQVYAFPSAFLGNWSQYGYSQASIPQAAAKASYNGSAYQSLFLTDLDQTFSNSASSLGPVGKVQNATHAAAFSSFFTLYPFLIFPVLDTAGYNVTNYRTDVMAPVTNYLSEASGFKISAQLVESALVAGDNASKYYFSEYGLSGAPSFITQEYVSPDNSTYVINVNFNVTEDYRGPNDFYPAQNATAEIRSLSEKYLGAAEVTGQGAVAADTAQATASAGYVFGLIFVFLAIAVGLLFASYLPPILALIVVSIATAIGYVSIYLTGLAIGHVDYIVTYLLTAVVLGVSTDYFVFILSRYRDELRTGKTNFEALSIATRRAGFAVVVSGLTVAVSLGAISLVSGIDSWGPVLFLTILLTVALETTLVPAMLSLVGPRIFMGGRLFLRGRYRPPTNSSDRVGARPSMERSTFYRVVKFSQRRKFLIIGVIALLAVAPVYLWFNLPTTYNLNEGLPQGISSVQALNTIDQKFGSSVIYPTFVVVNFNQSATTGFGGLTQAATATLETDARLLLDTQGVKQVIGPTINGTKIEPSSIDAQFVFNHGLNAYFIVFTKYDPYSTSAISVVNQLRQNSQFLVGGLTSSIIDLQSYYNRVFSQLEVVILVVIAIILGVSFRNLKYPFISLTGVFISITWTTAILYLITKYILGEQLVFLIPIVVYVILMSLGNDFAVFILSRVREEQKAFGFEEGLARAMVGSGAVVTGLGLILAVSLGSLGLVPFGYLEQLGITFVISLILDTFVIRIFYFPSMLLVLRGKQSESDRDQGQIAASS